MHLCLVFLETPGVHLRLVLRRARRARRARPTVAAGVVHVRVRVRIHRRSIVLGRKDDYYFLVFVLNLVPAAWGPYAAESSV